MATFCYQLTHNQTPKIEIDGELKLIYIAELVDHFLDKIDSTLNNQHIKVHRFEVPFTKMIKVSELLFKLIWFKDQYFENGIIPSLNDFFDRNLFNTLLTYIDHKAFFPICLKAKYR